MIFLGIQVYLDAKISFYIYTSTIMEWIINNKEWIFSGAGVIILAAIIKYFWSKKDTKSELKTDHSINQSMGTDINAPKGSVEFKDNKQELNVNPDKSKS